MLRMSLNSTIIAIKHNAGSERLHEFAHLHRQLSQPNPMIFVRSAFPRHKRSHGPSEDHKYTLNALREILEMQSRQHSRQNSASLGYIRLQIKAYTSSFRLYFFRKYEGLHSHHHHLELLLQHTRSQN